MKKLLTILCLILLSFHSYSQEVFTGPFLKIDGITYHQDTSEPVTGIIEIRGHNDYSQSPSRIYYKDGIRDGPYKIFHTDSPGRLLVRGNYKDGIREGLWEWFYRTRQLRTIVNYKNGIQDGLLENYYKNCQDYGPVYCGQHVGETYHNNGQVRFRFNLKDGEITGVLERFHKNGQLDVIGNLMDEKETLEYGHYNSQWIGYYEGGQLFCRGEIIDDDRKDIYKWFYTEELSSHRYGLCGGVEILYPWLRDGPWESFHENGQLRSRENWYEGKQEGLWESFHENGQLKSRENWYEGKLEGLWERYDNGNGNLIETRVYKDGVLQE